MELQQGMSERQGATSGLLVAVIAGSSAHLGLRTARWAVYALESPVFAGGLRRNPCPTPW
jgi:hypothetical protein